MLLGVSASEHFALGEITHFGVQKRRQFFCRHAQRSFSVIVLRFSLELHSGTFRRTGWEQEASASFTTKRNVLHNCSSLEAFLKAKWHMIRGVNRPTIRTDVYEIRPRADKHGVDLVSDALPYSPMWYRGPKAIRDAIDHAKFFSRSHDAAIRVYDAAGNVIETHKHASELGSPQSR